MRRAVRRARSGPGLGSVGVGDAGDVEDAAVGAGRRTTARPGTEAGPGRAAGTERPGADRPATGAEKPRPGSAAPETDPPRTDAPETDVPRPGASPVSTAEAGARERDVRQPDLKGRDVRGPDGGKPDLRGRDVPGPDVREPDPPGGGGAGEQSPPDASGGTRGRGGRAPAAKSDRTRALILETAMRLFEERGYDRTTMRAIAKEAGVSVGNAYYYYESKEHLVQGFYDRMSHDHALVARAALAGHTDFGERLDIGLRTWLDCASPYHEFAAQFFRNAADPDSPLSPFSEDSHPARAVAVQIWREVLMESAVAPKMDAELAEMMPDILWLHQMGVVLYWVFDRSPGQERTREFARRCTPVVARLVGLSRYRVLRPLLRDAKQLIRDFIVPTLARVPTRR